MVHALCPIVDAARTSGKPMPRDQHEQLEAIVAAYVLGACEGDAALARSHLRSCPSCRRLAARVGTAAGALALSVEPVSPPEGLRSRLMAAAAAHPR